MGWSEGYSAVVLILANRVGLGAVEAATTNGIGQNDALSLR